MNTGAGPVVAAAKNARHPPQESNALADDNQSQHPVARQKRTPSDAEQAEGGWINLRHGMGVMIRCHSGLIALNVCKLICP